MSRTISSISKVTILALVLLAAPCSTRSLLAQEQGDDPEMRIQQLEEKLRQVTGQNEELQYRNRQLEEQVKQLQGGQPPQRANVAVAPQAPPYPATPTQPNYPPPQQSYPPNYQTNVQPNYQPAYPQVAPPPVNQARMQVPPPEGRARGDAFDPAVNPNAPGAPRPLGSIVGQPSAPLAPDVGAPGGRGAGEPLDLANTNTPRQADAGQAPTYPPDGRGAPPAPAGPVVATLPPTNTPRDAYDLGYGYIERKDYALADQTFRDFLQKYPSDRLVPDAQYWLGESLYQRQRYRDAAESFLTITTKFENSSRAPEALLRLGQSLAALKEKEAACAAFGEVSRKYPKASGSVKQGVDREQKRVHC